MTDDLLAKLVWAAIGTGIDCGATPEQLKRVFRPEVIGKVAEMAGAKPVKKLPSSLAKTVAYAKDEYDSWSPEKRASVRLEGSSDLRQMLKE